MVWTVVVAVTFASAMRGDKRKVRERHRRWFLNEEFKDSFWYWELLRFLVKTAIIGGFAAATR